MAKKRITRKQLLNEPDEFISVSSRLIRFGVDHKTPGLLGVAVFFIAIIALSGYHYFSNKAENTASALLQMNINQYAQAMTKKSPEQAREQVKAGFEQIMDSYGRTEAAKMARAIYAGICFRAGDIDKAISLYTESLDNYKEAPAICSLFTAGLGYCYEQKGEIQKAIDCFKKVADGTDAVGQDEALFNLGRLYADLGMADKSRDAFRTLIDSQSDSPYAELARERVAAK
jgi:tetratricopeptide (TPR) repeat protein